MFDKAGLIFWFPLCSYFYKICQGLVWCEQLLGIRSQRRFLSPGKTLFWISSCFVKDGFSIALLHVHHALCGWMDISVKWNTDSSPNSLCQILSKLKKNIFFFLKLLLSMYSLPPAKSLPLKILESNSARFAAQNKEFYIKQCAYIAYIASLCGCGAQLRWDLIKHLRTQIFTFRPFDFLFLFYFLSLSLFSVTRHSRSDVVHWLTDWLDVSINLTDV